MTIMPSSRRIMFGDESIARQCFKCINGRRYFSLWRVIGNKRGQVSETLNPEEMFQMHKWKKVLFTVESYWEQAGPGFRNFKSRGNVSCDKYFHQNEPHKLNWKTFPDRRVCASKL